MSCDRLLSVVLGVAVGVVFGSVAMPSPPHIVLFCILIVQVLRQWCFNYFISHLIGCCLRRCWKCRYPRVVYRQLTPSSPMGVNVLDGNILVSKRSDRDSLKGYK